MKILLDEFNKQIKTLQKTRLVKLKIVIPAMKSYSTERKKIFFK